MGGKLVRDKIPDIIRAQGREPVVRLLDESDYVEALHKKLHEEATEYTESASVEELADIIEVLHALAETHQISMDNLESVRLAKRAERGGFLLRLFLEDVDCDKS